MLLNALKLFVVLLFLSFGCTESGNSDDRGYLVVSTLDGEIKALDVDGGRVKWQFQTSDLLVAHSSISDLEIVRDGRDVKLIPSLNGGLYQFDGESFRYFPLRIESLLTRSQQISETLLASGELTTSIYGIDAKSGRLVYTCEKDGCVRYDSVEPDASEVLVFTRRRETLRAVDIRHGSEMWNYSVTHFDLLSRTARQYGTPTNQQGAEELPVADQENGSESAADDQIATFVTIAIPERKVTVRDVRIDGETVRSWDRTFDASIAQVWHVSSSGRLRKLTALDSRLDSGSSAQTKPESSSSSSTRQRQSTNNSKRRFVTEVTSDLGRWPVDGKPRQSVLYLSSHGGQLFVNANFEQTVETGDGDASDTAVANWRPYIGSAASRTPILHPCTSRSLWKFDRDPSNVAYPFDFGLCLSPGSSPTQLRIASDAVSEADQKEVGSLRQLLEQRDDSKTIAIVMPYARNADRSALSCENDSCETPYLDSSTQTPATCPLGGSASAVPELGTTLWSYWPQVAMISVSFAVFLHVLLLRFGWRFGYSVDNRGAEQRPRFSFRMRLPNRRANFPAPERFPDVTLSESAVDHGPTPQAADGNAKKRSRTTSKSAKGDERTRQNSTSVTSTPAPGLKKNGSTLSETQANLSTASASAGAGEFCSRYETDYEHDSCLGWGGFGVVFKARNRIDDQFYAVKRITLRGSAHSRSRMMREVKCLAKLDHPNVVRFYQAWCERPPNGWQAARDRHWLRRCLSNDDIDCEDAIGSGIISGPLDSIMSATASSGSTDRLQSHPDASVSANPNRIDFNDLRLPKRNNADSVDIVFTKSAGSIKYNQSATSNSSSTADNRQHATDTTSQSTDSDSQDENEHEHESVREAEADREYLYIQMQLCNESLKDWLARDNDRICQCKKSSSATSKEEPCLFRFRDRPAALGIFGQIADAVYYIHKAQLIHRDLKPSNILFSPDGRVIVGDFGLVTAQFNDEQDAGGSSQVAGSSQRVANGSHTQEVGTQTYMSPEQRNGRSYDEKVDIYALGLILFELLHPFSTEMERASLLCDAKKGVLPASFVEELPLDCALLRRMLSESPADRPSSEELLKSGTICSAQADGSSNPTHKRWIPRVPAQITSEDPASNGSTESEPLRNVPNSTSGRWNPLNRSRGMSRCESTPNAVVLGHEASRVVDVSGMQAT